MHKKSNSKIQFTSIFHYYINIHVKSHSRPIFHPFQHLVSAEISQYSRQIPL